MIKIKSLLKKNLKRIKKINIKSQLLKIKINPTKLKIKSNHLSNKVNKSNKVELKIAQKRTKAIPKKLNETTWNYIIYIYMHTYR